MALIPLSQGLTAVVDDEDFNRVSQYKWSAYKSGNNFYALSEKQGKLHRFILDLTSNDPEIDHIDGDGLNNRKSNLRLCTHQQNIANQKVRKGTLSCFKGVTWHKNINKWTAQIMFNYKNIYLGCHKDEERAAVYYDMAAVYLFGRFAKINFPERLEEYLKQREMLLGEEDSDA